MSVNAQALKYKEKGNAHFKKGEMGLAIECYTYATEMDPKNHVFFTNRAAAYAHMKKWDKSLRDSKKSIKLNAAWTKGHWRAGNAYMEMKNFDEALKCYETAAQLEPNNQTWAKCVINAKNAFFAGKSQAEILKKNGNDEYGNGQIEKALETYTKAYKACKGDEKSVKADILCNRALCYRQLYNPKGVIDDCTEALELNPMAVKAFVRRAQGYEQTEKYKLALQDYESACRLQPNMKAAYTGAARVRSSLRNMGKI